jgi:hypothetical protein
MSFRPIKTHAARVKRREFIRLAFRLIIIKELGCQVISFSISSFVFSYFGKLCMCIDFLMNGMRDLENENAIRRGTFRKARVARTCCLGPRPFLVHRGRAADLKNRSALHLLNSKVAGSRHKATRPAVVLSNATSYGRTYKKSLCKTPSWERTSTVFVGSQPDTAKSWETTRAPERSCSSSIGRNIVLTKVNR